MATYVVLTTFTGMGAQAVKDSPNRFEAGQPLLAQMGINIRAHF